MKCWQRGKEQKEVARELVLKSTHQKNEALAMVANQLISETAYILEGKQTGYRRR